MLVGAEAVIARISSSATGTTAVSSVKKYPVLRPGSPFFTGKSGFGVVGIGFGMARGGGKIG